MSSRTFVKTQIVPLGLALLLLSMSACGFPRGESKSLKQVLETARSRYKAVQHVAIENDAVEDRLLTILKTLEALEKANGAHAEKLASLGKDLAEIIPHAGYTVRPALNELMKQYLAMSKEENPNHNASLLLASRTYSILASELETTRFKL